MMLKSFASRQKHPKLSIVGQVTNAITKQGVAGARVKIIEAPAEFIDRVIFKAKLLKATLFEGSGFQHQFHRSLESPSASVSLPTSLQEFQTALDSAQLKSADKLQRLYQLLDDPGLIAQHKFQALQWVCDRLRSVPNAKHPPLDRTDTTIDGWFYLVDLPAGHYQLVVMLPNTGQSFGVAQVQVEVPEPTPLTQSEHYATFFEQRLVNVELHPTTLLGKVISADESQEAIGMVRVQIAGTENYVFSSKEVIKQSGNEWNYRFLGLDANNPSISLILSAQGYMTAQQTVRLETGKIAIADIQLVSR